MSLSVFNFESEHPVFISSTAPDLGDRQLGRPQFRSQSLGSLVVLRLLSILVYHRGMSFSVNVQIVHPRKFTSAIMSAAQRNGAQLCLGRVTGMTRSADGSTTRGVEVDGRVVEADAVVIAMGPWSLLAANWMVLPAVFGQRSPSVVYDTGTDVPPEALFLDYHEDDGSVSTAEVFPRADGSTHVTAFSDIVPLPLDPATVTPDADAIDRLEAICERLSPVFRADRIIARQACFRPVTEDGLPLIGKVPQLDGAHVATGHNVWGILNAPATGEALAELIGDGVARTTDLTPFDPTRLRRLDPLLLRSS